MPLGHVKYGKRLLEPFSMAGAKCGAVLGKGYGQAKNRNKNANHTMQSASKVNK
jgi:hypothetical protein